MSAQERLEYLRGEIRAERISYAELAELQSLASEIDSGDTELLEAAGVPEQYFPVSVLTPEQVDTLLGFALAVWWVEIGYAPEVRSVDDEQMRAVHDVLVELGQIDPEPEFDNEGGL